MKKWTVLRTRYGGDGTVGAVFRGGTGYWGAGMLRLLCMGWKGIGNGACGWTVYGGFIGGGDAKWGGWCIGKLLYKGLACRKDGKLVLWC